MVNKNLKSCVQYLFYFVLVIIIVLSMRWAFTLYHEKGHLDACEATNISCVREGKSLGEFLRGYARIFYNRIPFFTEMKVKPINQSEFCNLSQQHQQLIRVAGFKNDVVIITTLVWMLLIESFTALVLLLILRKKNVDKEVIQKMCKWAMVLVIFTLLPLLFQVWQIKSYVLANAGDLFYFPCS